MSFAAYDPTIIVLKNDRVSSEDAARQSHTVEKLVGRLAEQPGAILADEVGMGKTFVAMAVAVSSSAPGLTTVLWSSWSRPPSKRSGQGTGVCSASCACGPIEIEKFVPHPRILEWTSCACSTIRESGAAM